MSDQPTRERLFITVDRDGWTKGTQVSLSTDSGGYRLAGPKYNGSSKNLVQEELAERDAREIRRMLDKAFPPKAAPVADLTVYELRTGPDDDPRPDVIAQYSTTLAAMEHGEAQYRAKHGTTGTLEWPFTGTDDAPVWRLEAVDEWDGYEVPTDWHIVAVVIPAAYTPAGGESQ
jgi:hypothetical protein